MKKTIWILLPVLFMFCLAGCEKPSHHEVKQYTIEQFMDTTAIFGSSFSFDEQRIIFSSDESGIFNAYTVPAEGGDLVQMTFSEDDAVFAPVFFPVDSSRKFPSLSALKTFMIKSASSCPRAFRISSTVHK